MRRAEESDAEYPYKLWLAHGITTVRGVGLANHALAAKEQARSARNEIVAPRIVNYQTPGSGWDQGPIDTPAQMRAWVQWASQNGVDGIKFFGTPHDLVEALLDEAKKVKLGTVAHLGQTGVAQMDALEAARLGLDTVTHFYGHFEALMKDYRVQPWPPEMNYNNEQWRFGQVARMWDKIYEPGSPEWKAYLQEHVKLGTTFDPTTTAYAAGRDVMRMRTAEWHDKYTLPSLMDFYTPSLVNHGAYFHDWTSTDEVAWRNFYQVWFKLLNDYKKMGGRVTVSADEAFIYNTYGFGYIHEMELLHEAGFNPLEVIQAATFNPRDARRAERPADRARRGPGRLSCRHGPGRSEPAPQPQGAVRHGRAPPQLPDRQRRAHRRHQKHHQGRHRLRREAVAGRRRRHGAGAEGRAREED